MENKKEINIKVSGENWSKYIDQSFEKANKKIKIDGFRLGKAPKETFIKKKGIEFLLTEAADLAIHDSYHKVIEENAELKIVAQPLVDITKIDETEVEFVFTLLLNPEVKLKKYKKLGVTKETVEVTKEEIDKTIEEMRNKFAENVIKDGEIENGDVAVIDFEGFKDNVAFDGGKGENYSLTIGSNTFIPGFEEQLIGLKKGEQKDINVTFPADYHSEDLKGAPVVFKVKINEIKGIQIPEINEDFFEDLGMEGINDITSLEKQVKENIQTQKEAQLENKFIDALLDKAVENVEVELHDSMITEEQERILNQYKQNLSMQGITIEQFYQFTNTTEETLKEQFKEEAIKRIKSRLLLEEVVKLEKIEVSEEEVSSETEKLAEKYQMKKEDFIKNFGGTDMIKYDLEMRKAIDVLKDNN